VAKGISATPVDCRAGACSAAAMSILPEYFVLLYNAHAASDAVDQFDIARRRREAAASFDRLLADQASAHLALINHVAANALALEEAIRGKL
jgi:hypothetical protein